MDETISFHLFPRHPIFWLLWVMSMLIVFPVYYIGDSYYRAMSQQHEKNKWIECGIGSTCEEIGFDASGVWEVYVRQPRYVADFVESNVEIRLTNISAMTQNGLLTIQITPEGETNNRFMHYQIGELRQNFVNVENVQANGQVFYEFTVKVIGGRDTERYILSVYLDGKPIQNGYDFSSYPLTFNSVAMLWLWAEAYLLSPPGANIVIPVILLLMVSLSQLAYFISSKLFTAVVAILNQLFSNNILNWREILRKLPRIVVFVVSSLILWSILRSTSINYQPEVNKILEPLLQKDIFSLGKNILQTLIWAGFFGGIVEQSWKYNKDRDVHKVSIIKLPENRGVE